jgi:hypothetical protein
MGELREAVRGSWGLVGSTKLALDTPLRRFAPPPPPPFGQQGRVNVRFPLTPPAFRSTYVPSLPSGIRFMTVDLEGSGDR